MVHVLEPYDDTMGSSSQALELCQASGNKAGEQVALLNLGTTCELIGDTEKAIEWHTLVRGLSVEMSVIHSGTSTDWVSH